MAKKKAFRDDSGFDSRTLYQGKPHAVRLSASNKISRTTNRTKRDRSLLNEFQNQLSNTMFSTFQPARLYNGKGDITKHWRVEYAYLIPGTIDKYKRFTDTFDMNRIADFDKRMIYAEAAVEFMNKKLAEGFNPFETVKVKASEDTGVQSQMFKLKAELSQTASEYTKSTYTEVYNRVVKYLAASNLTTKTMAQISVDQVKHFKKWMIGEKLAKKTINSTLSYLSKFWVLALEKKIVAHNPFALVPRVTKRERLPKKETEVERFEPLNSDEMDKIFHYLIETNETELIAFLAMIYYAWVRPIEVTRLKISDLEFKRDAIRFRSSQTKNERAAYVQMVPPLKKILQKLQLENYPADQYIFSKNNLLPGLDKLDKHYVGKRWRAIVKENLQINKDMYALKHTGNIEYLLKNKGNVDLKWQQKQNRHSSTAQTETYNRKLGAYFIEVGSLNYRHFV